MKKVTAYKKGWLLSQPFLFLFCHPHFKNTGSALAGCEFFLKESLFPYYIMSRILLNNL